MSAILSILSFLLKLIIHVVEVIFADGAKRVKLSFLHIISILLAVAAGFGAYFLIGNVVAAGGMDISTGSALADFFSGIGGIILAVIGGFVCILVAILNTTYGVISQAVLLVLSLIGIILPPPKNTRAQNIVTFIVCVISLAAMAIGLYILLTYVAPDIILSAQTAGEAITDAVA